MDQFDVTLTPAQESLAMELTDLQRNLVLGVHAGKTQRQAYYDAGGKATSDESADANASKLLSMDKVRGFRASLIDTDVKASIMTREQALERLTLIANTEITDILDFKQVAVKKVGKDGEEEADWETIWSMKDSPDVERKAKAAIKSVTMTKQGPKIEMYDATAAVAQIAKMQGWEAPTKVANTDSQGNDVPAQSIDSKLVSALIDKLVD